MKPYISDVVHKGMIKLGVFNLIDAGCGSGKTYFCMNHIFDVIDDITPEQVVFVTSRSITASQMEQNDDVDVTRLYAHEINDDDLEEMQRRGITVMTYDALCDYLIYANSGRDMSNKVKVIVVDECHTLFADQFIRGVSYAGAILNMIVNSNRVYVIGLTATSGIVRQYGNDVFSNIVDVCEPIPTRYPADNLIVSRMQYVPGMVRDKLHGKTIILVPYVRHAEYLHKRIPNSAVVVSKSRKTPDDDCSIVYTKEMDNIRECIATTRKIPEYSTEYDEKSGSMKTFPVEVLIATTTFREGFSLDEESGVDNVVCCFFDEMHITQFLGRCRYSVKNLIIAPPDKVKFSHKYADYFKKHKEAFIKYWNSGSGGWIDSVSSLVCNDVHDCTEIYICDEIEDSPNSFEESIAKYLNGEWISYSDIGIIVDSAREWNVLRGTGVKPCKYNRSNVSKYLESIGYTYVKLADTSRNKTFKYKFVKENINAET